jgi:ssDNA thymidine ADP-ribosyltransferase, DarT
MERHEVAELHYITPIENLHSILGRGILSHNRAARLEHRSVALESVQDIRRGKSVPGGSTLHSYANLYFHARNPMMYRLIHNGFDSLIVLRVSAEVFDIPNTVVTDGNAATYGTRFYPSPEGLEHLDPALIFAQWWTDCNYTAVLEKKRARNAEVLIPDLVASRYVEGCYVDTRAKQGACQSFARLRTVTISREIYFR